MKIRILNRKSVLLEKEITSLEFAKFGKENSDVHGFGFVIAIFDFLFKINISDYNMSDIMVSDDLITLNIKPEDVSKIREIKINKLFDSE